MKLIRKILIPLAVVAFLAVFLYMMLDSDLKHIEDTNGAENLALNTITDQDIIDMNMGSLNPGSPREALIGNGMEFSSKKFTGVYEVLFDNYILPSDFDLTVNTLRVTEGNFRMVVVHDNKIVAEIYPNGEEPSAHVRLENITGYVSLRIVGESASYSFQMSALDYDEFSHP